MGKAFSALKIILVQLLVLSIISGLMGCSTGGLSDGPAQGTTPDTTPPPAVITVTINGRVVDGAIAGATVQAYQINANGTRGDAIGSSTTTDSNGNYSLSLNYNGPVLVESVGGAYTDWATGKTVSLTTTDKLSAVMSNAKDTVTINVTPLTHMAALRAQQDMAVSKTAAVTAIETANSKIGDYFGGINILKDTPIDPAVSNSASGVSQARIDQALILAGISQYALTNNLNPFSLAFALAKDVSDGVFDGKQGTTQLTVANATGSGTTNLSASAAKDDLSVSINTFQNSSANKSGGTITSSITASLSSPTNTGAIAAKPDIPAGFTAVVISSTQINLSWSVSSGATGYNIFKDGAKLKSVTTTSTSDAGLTPNTQYCYAISAFDASGNESAQSSQLCATTNVVAPPAPTSLKAAAVSSSRIDLSWTAAAGATSYKIYKGGVLLKSVTTTATSDTDLSASTQYCYSVSATDNSGNESAQSSQLCASTYGLPPAIPTGLTVRATSPTQVDLSWAGSVGASQYKVYRNGVLLAGAVVLAPATTYSDTTVAANTQYSYAIVAIDATGSESSPTSQSPAHTGLTVPSGVTATVNSSTQITLSWTNSGGALVAGYKVYKNGLLLGAVSPVTTASMVDGGLTSSTQYCYSISATDISGNESAQSSTICATTQATPAPPVPASMDLLVSNTQLNSDGASTVILTALVKDSANRAMKDQSVDFSSSSGLLIVTNGKTDANGTATATLGTGGDPVNRSLTLTAATGSIKSTNTVNVSGTTIDISGLNSLSLDDSTPLTIFLKNSAGVGIQGKTVTVTSEKGNTLTATSYVTNADGQITVNVKAAVGGLDSLTADAIGARKVFSLTVDPNLFKIRTPVPAQEVNIGTNEPITVEYTTSGAPVVGATVNFATTRGTLSGATAITGADGKATITSSSTNSGPALISAFVTGGPSAQVAIEFVAPDAIKMSLQANPSVIGTNGEGLTAEKSLITAIVRDANDNLVKNKTVKFTIVNDSSGGRLSPGSATTDSSGTANTYFIAGATPGAKDGVTIQASVVDSPAVTAATKLTVGTKAMFISLSTGPTILKADPNKYQKIYVALITDAAGTPIKDATVQATVIPMYFEKGYYVWTKTGVGIWSLVSTLAASSTNLPAIPACANEDSLTHNSLYDYNGVIDSGEDVNLNNRLDPGNVASVTSTSTDSNGFSTVTITYAQDYAYWVNVKLEVRASTAADTSSAYVTFNLEGLASDYTNETIRPPGAISPFGTSSTCFDTRPDPPAGLTAAVVSTTQINLSWQAAERAKGYKIYRNDIFLKSVATVTGMDTGLSSGTQYCYTVSSYDETGNDSAPSAQVCVTTPSLVAPANLSVTAASSSQINLSWTASAGAVSYKIYKAGAYLKSVAATNATDTGLNSSTQYCYAVSALDAAGIESAQTGQLCATTPALAAPTNLTVTAATSSQIDLTWTASSGVSGYRIYKGGTYLKSVAATSASDTGLVANTQYCYTVSAYDSANNESPQTSQVCATTYGPPPPDPGNLTTFVETPTKVILSWSASVGATQYYIYRNGTKIDTSAAPVTGTTYTDTAATANAQNIYKVTAIDATGSESAGLLNQVTVNTALTVPTMSSITANTSSQITVGWANAGAGTQVAGYKIYRNGSLVKTIPSAATLTYADGTGLVASTQYCYRVSALDALGNESAQSSASLCATTYGPPPSDPGNLTTFVETPTKVILSWSASVGATQYYIYRNGTKIDTSAAPVTGTTYTDTAATANAQNIYKVTAIDATGSESAGLLNQVTVNTALTVPSMSSITANTSSQITVGWANAGAGTQVAGYKIYRNGSLAKTIPSAATLTYADGTGLVASTQYCYRVSALDALGNESAQSSASLCATTYGPPPSDPGNLTTFVETPTKVILSWSASVGATQYYIYRNGTKIDTSAAPVTGTTYTDTAATANAQNIYKVTAIDATGSESAGLLNQVTVNTALTVPTMSSITANTSSQITVGWANAGAGTQVAGYKIYRNGSLVRTIPSAATLTYADGTGLVASTQYCYRVSALDALGNESAQSSASLCATTPSPPAPTYIDLLVSNPQLNSDGVTTVTLTALVKDDGNRAMGGETVTFTADSGILTVVNSVTNASGQATATLGTGGNQKNRTITVAASVGSLTTIPPKTVAVAGTAVTISGQTNTVLIGSTTTLTVYLKDSAGKGIPNENLTLVSANGNTLAPTTVTTDASGQATTVFTATDTLGRTDTITAASASMNAAGTFAVTVQTNATDKTLTFTAPTSGQEVVIKTNENVKVNYADINGAIAGATVNFASSRGTIASTAVTDGSGDATLTISSTTPGPVVLTASVTGGPTATVSFEFVAITAAKINLQADPATIGVNLSGSTTQQSQIVAVVRDADDNLIKNKTVNFNITDPSGGSLSAGTAVTDSFGLATVQFIAGATPSAKDGVMISATVAGTAVTASTTMTVAQRPLFITVGTGNDVRKIDPNNYQVDFGVLVTDAAGNPIKEASVTASLMPVVYMKGAYATWIWDTASTGHWQQTLTLTSSNHPSPPGPNTPYSWPGSPLFSCANEDLTYYNDPNNTAYLSNGIMDGGEDFNGNGRLDPGGIAAVTTSAKTDANGVGTLTVTYARQFATWAIIRLDVKVLVSGTEGTASTTLLLPGSRADYTNFDLDPPGKESPFGQSATCADSL